MPAVKPKNNNNLRGNSSQLQSMHAYRCFYMKFGKGDSYDAVNVFPAITGDVPESFVWNSRTDVDGLHKYIDAVLLGKKSEALHYENIGMVSDIKIFQMDRPKDPTIRVISRRFTDFMLLRDHFNVPLWGRIHFITDGKRIVPREFLASIGAAIDPNKEFIDPSGDWQGLNDTKLKEMGLKPEDITSSMYRKDTPAPIGVAAAVGNTDEIEVEPREIEIDRIIGKDHVDLLTQVIPSDGSPPYFARRLFLFKQVSGHLLWEGTSYSPKGPWSVWFRNSAKMLALSIGEP